MRGDADRKDNDNKKDQANDDDDTDRRNIYIVSISPRTKVYQASGDSGKADQKKEASGKKDSPKADGMHADAEDAVKPPSDDDDDDASAMMSGVKPGAHGKSDEKKKPPLPVTAFGRYVVQPLQPLLYASR